MREGKESELDLFYVTDDLHAREIPIAQMAQPVYELNGGIQNKRRKVHSDGLRERAGLRRTGLMGGTRFGYGREIWQKKDCEGYRVRGGLRIGPGFENVHRCIVRAPSCFRSSDE